MVVSQTTGFDSKISNLTGNSGKKVKDSKESISEDFVSFLSVNTKEEQSVKTKSKEDTNSTSVDSSDEGYYYKEKNSNNVITKKEVGDNKFDNTKVSDDAVEDEEMDLETLEAIAAALQNSITSILDISVEDLENMLSDMGLEMTDLIDKENLVDFILNFSGAEKIDLITNEELAKTVNQLSQNLDQIVKLFDSQDVEDVDFLQNMKDMLGSSDKVAYSKVDNEGALNEEDSSDTNIRVSIDKTSVLSKIDDESNKPFSKNMGEESKKESKEHMFTHEEVANDIVNNLNRFVSEVEMVENSFGEEVSSADILNQLIDNIKVNINKDTTSMELQLYPEHLGKIQIQVSTKDGMVTASIVAENEAAKNAIESGLSNLKEVFNNQELKVEAVEVSVATTGFDQQRDGNTNDSEDASQTKSSRRINLNDLDSIEDLDENEELEVEMMQASGNSVSYQA